ncbi:MAG: hypothetical protein APR53_00810 [Methanoculleus sp. SDB]|nr:MAG: hypothetical protein APR53_00810 [Methanoculleus sp. SDB]
MILKHHPRHVGQTVRRPGRQGIPLTVRKGVRQGTEHRGIPERSGNPVFASSGTSIRSPRESPDGGDAPDVFSRRENPEPGRPAISATYKRSGSHYH